MCRLFTQCVAYSRNVSLSQLGECVNVGIPWPSQGRERSERSAQEQVVVEEKQLNIRKNAMRRSKEFSAKRRLGSCLCMIGSYSNNGKADCGRHGPLPYTQQVNILVYYLGANTVYKINLHGIIIQCSTRACNIRVTYVEDESEESNFS
jgi:hypothetical protein